MKKAGFQPAFFYMRLTRAGTGRPVSRIPSAVLSVLSELIPLLKVRNASAFTSGAVLVAANLVPLAGILFLKWDVFMLLILYWMESAVIGIFNEVKMITATLLNPENRKIENIILSVFLCCFFLVHFGGFMAGHLVFLLLFVGLKSGHSSDPFQVGGGIFSGFAEDLSALLQWPPDFGQFFDSYVFSLLVLLISHGFSLNTHFFRNKTYLKTAAADFFISPYKRIFVMHITIIGGGFLVFIFPGSTWLAALWIFLKINADLRGHLKEHDAQKASAPGKQQ